MATKFSESLSAEEATRVAERLNQECKRLGENSRKLMREYRQRVQPTPDRLPSETG